jgi:predicted dehydrogenase
MWNFAIVGAGRIGSRHAQGLARIEEDCRVHVVDPSSESRALTRRRWADVAGGTERLSEEESVDGIAGGDVDLAIVATTARHRRAATETLLEACRVENLVLEKVLFQRDESYEAVGALLAEEATDTWVNCPRRSYDVYQNMANEIDDGRVDVDVTGTSWGLGCNGVHFVDLFTWFTGGSTITWDRSALDRDVVESHRDGFVEFHGRLTGRDSAGNSISLRSFEGSGRTLSVRVSTPSNTWHVHEFVEQQVQERLDTDGPVLDSDRVSIPYQSELTGAFARDIVTAGECPLPRYELAASEHRPFVDALRAHVEDIRGGEVDRCPIT